MSKKTSSGYVLTWSENFVLDVLKISSFKIEDDGRIPITGQLMGQCGEMHVLYCPKVPGHLSLSLACDLNQGMSLSHWIDPQRMTRYRGNNI